MDIHPIYDYVNKQMGPLTTNELSWFHFQNALNTKVLLNYYFDGHYRSGTVNSNTINSKFHLIRSLFEIFARFLSFHV